MFLLDTTVISELRRPAVANRNVVAWARSTPVAGFFLSAITILEIEIGVLLRRRKDPAQGAMLRTWIDNAILPRFDGRILPVDTAVALRCAQLHLPDPRGERDALIAATAMVHGLTVASRNVHDFAPMGVKLINPWHHSG